MKGVKGVMEVKRVMGVGKNTGRMEKNAGKCKVMGVMEVKRVMGV